MGIHGAMVETEMVHRSVPMTGSGPLPSRTADANPVVRGNHETGGPIGHLLHSEHHANSLNQCPTRRLTHTNDEDAGMCSWYKSTPIREVEILSQEKAPVPLGCLPNRCVIVSGKSLARHRIHVVAQIRQFGRQFRR